MTVKQKRNLRHIIEAICLIIIITLIFHLIWKNAPWWAKLCMYLIPYAVVGYDIVKGAVKNIGHGQVFDEKFLMTIATAGAFLLGQYTEGVAVMLFYQIGELFQSIAVGRSRRNISELMDIRPDTANLLHEDGTVTVESPENLGIGNIIVVNPGEKVPVDGAVIDGVSSIDTSALTGESVPRTVRSGDKVISGCINISGQIKVKTEKIFGESTASKILDLVENSSMKKAKAENFISKFARYYTPVVVYGALALALIPPLIRMLAGDSADWSEWITRALTSLVISCPCAVVISVPLSFFGGIGSASSHGILVKGSNYLEVLADTNEIVFDKTGTLTKGVFEVVEAYAFNGFTKEELITCAAYAESASSHPIAVSIRNAYEKGSEGAETKAHDKIDVSRISEITEIAGGGVSAVLDKEKHISIGNDRLMKQIGVSYDNDNSDRTVVYVAENGKFAGKLIISDIIKPTAKEAVAELHKQGIHTVMLTGDRIGAAENTAKEIGIKNFRAELLPTDKVAEVEKLINKNGKNERLAFVGDGINDAPVLARADIGIAMGALGSDAAIEAADVVLMDDDPLKISLAMKISKKTLHIVRENIVFAITVKVVCLLLGAAGLVNMWIAIFADVGVMILAVINATRCLIIKNDKNEKGLH